MGIHIRTEQQEIIMGTNWNSKLNKHTPIIKEGTKYKASQVKAMVEEEGMSVAEIAEVMNLSVSRIYEYLKDPPSDQSQEGSAMHNKEDSES